MSVFCLYVYSAKVVDIETEYFGRGNTPTIVNYSSAIKRFDIRFRNGYRRPRFRLNFDKLILPACAAGTDFVRVIAVDVDVESDCIVICKQSFDVLRFFVQLVRRVRVIGGRNVKFLRLVAPPSRN